jgi:predicted Zn-dependent peptidase
LISGKEFKKLRNQIENDFYSRKNNVRGKALALANYQLFYDNPNLFNTELERYMNVTREDLKRVANEYLVKENRTVLHYLPKSLKP